MLLQEMMERERQNAHSSVARERARTVAAERDAESACSQADARKRQLQHDLDDAHSEVQPDACSHLCYCDLLHVVSAFCAALCSLSICGLLFECHFGIISPLLLTLLA